MTYSSLTHALTALRGEVRVTTRLPLSGGDINRAYKLCLSDGSSLFLKENHRDKISLFKTESSGLDLIGQVGEIDSPRPLAFGIEGEASFLLLPFLEGTKEPLFYEKFGASLAQFHLSGKGESFGLGFDNFIGSTVQKNKRSHGWVDFFREMRLDYQVNLASDHIDGVLSRQFLKLLDKLEDYLPEPQFPTLLHGDLWSGNFLVGPNGKAWLIDPAVYYGHGEADLAMTELFGGFPKTFYDSYRETSPLEPGYADRKDLYNLYHLLNHLNLFGPSYLGSVQAVVKKYV